jgi:hypothetical protein
VKIIRLCVFQIIPIAIIAALVFLGDRSMDCALTKAQVTGVVVIASLLTLLILVLLICLQRKHKDRKGGSKKLDE